MNRREWLLGGMALAGAAIAGNAQADVHQHDMSMHEHHHADPANTALAKSASDCIQTGQVCLDHCLMLLGDGEKDMAACAKSVNQMLALCGALQQLANQHSTLLPTLATLAQDACDQCEAACKKHAGKHDQCKACGDSCAACAKECRKLAG